MKKLIYDQYGSVEVLKLIHMPFPIPSHTQLLVKVKAVSINPLDWKIREGKMKLMAGSKFPKSVGSDFSGVVETTGSGISKFQAGDAVFGLVDLFKGGALAEYILVSENQISRKPASLSFEQAAALPTAGLAALQIFEKLLRLSPGDEILINGAAGGIGPFAIQLAKKGGAKVTSVVGRRGLSLAKSWGSDRVINYETEEVLKTGEQYDGVIDLSGKMSFGQAKTLLKPRGTYINSVPGPRQLLESVINNLFSSRKYKVLFLKPSAAGLDTLAALASGGLTIHVGASFTMDSYKEAYARIQKEGILGKAVIVL